MFNYFDARYFAITTLVVILSLILFSHLWKLAGIYSVVMEEIYCKKFNRRGIYFIEHYKEEVMHICGIFSFLFVAVFLAADHYKFYKSEKISRRRGYYRYTTAKKERETLSYKRR